MCVCGFCGCGVGFVVVVVFLACFLFAFFLIRHGIQNILITRVPQIKLKLKNEWRRNL